MKIVHPEQLPSRLQHLPHNPRVIASGNFATPRTLLRVVDEALPAYRLHILNAQRGLPDRAGVTHETAFVGPGVRNCERLDYMPCRLSLVPVLFHRYAPPDLVLLHTSMPHEGTVSLGLEVNVMPAAIEAARRRGALVIAQANPRMPYTYGDAQIDLEDIDLAIEADEPLATSEPSAPDDVSSQIEKVQKLLAASGATEIRLAADEQARVRFWSGRKNAFPAMGRISPDYYCMDGTIPRRELGRVLTIISRLSEKHGLRVAFRSLEGKQQQVDTGVFQALAHEAPLPEFFFEPDEVRLQLAFDLSVVGDGQEFPVRFQAGFRPVA